MQFSVEEKIFEFFPNMNIAIAIARGINNTDSNPEITNFLKETCSELVNNFTAPNAQSHPKIQPWREGMKRAGASGKKFPSSIEALARRVLKEETLPAINPLVDLYNAISIKYIVPAGGYDLEEIEDNLFLRLTTEGELFRELGTTESVSVNAGEIAYTDDKDILTRHFVWRQSEKSKIDSDSKNILLLSEILEEIGTEVADGVLKEFEASLGKFFGVEAQTFMVTPENSVITF